MSKSGEHSVTRAVLTLTAAVDSCVQTNERTDEQTKKQETHKTRVEGDGGEKRGKSLIAIKREITKKKKKKEKSRRGKIRKTGRWDIKTKNKPREGGGEKKRERERKNERKKRTKRRNGTFRRSRLILTMLLVSAPSARGCPRVLLPPSFPPAAPPSSAD